VGRQDAGVGAVEVARPLRMVLPKEYEGDFILLTEFAYDLFGFCQKC
jgi:hypothetical protein